MDEAGYTYIIRNIHINNLKKEVMNLRKSRVHRKRWREKKKKGNNFSFNKY